jgi:5-formyltetrahydrofolate cyclo-ligase
LRKLEPNTSDNSFQRNRLRLLKADLRKSAQASVISMGSERIFSLSETIREKVEDLAEFKYAGVVSSYVARRDEVQTEGIISDALKFGKRVLVPIVESHNRHLLFSEITDLSELMLGHFGILEPKPECIRPISLQKAQIILVPVVAWDEIGYRIGHGMGYFDIALEPLKGNLSVGLAFEAQQVDSIPVEPHDIPLKMIISEKRILRFSAE